MNDAIRPVRRRKILGSCGKDRPKGENRVRENKMEATVILKREKKWTRTKEMEMKRENKNVRCGWKTMDRTPWLT